MSDIAEHFAISLVSLALARAGYAVSKQVAQRGDQLQRFDLFASKVSGDVVAQFGVEVKATPHVSNAVRLRRPNGQAGWPVYLAVYAVKEEKLVVDDQLAALLEFRDDEIQLLKFSELGPLK